MRKRKKKKKKDQAKRRSRRGGENAEMRECIKHLVPGVILSITPSTPPNLKQKIHKGSTQGAQKKPMSESMNNFSPYSPHEKKQLSVFSKYIYDIQQTHFFDPHLLLTLGATSRLMMMIDESRKKNLRPALSCVLCVAWGGGGGGKITRKKKKSSFHLSQISPYPRAKKKKII